MPTDIRNEILSDIEISVEVVAVIMCGAANTPVTMLQLSFAVYWEYV